MPLNPKRLISVAIVLAGIVLAAWTWRAFQSGYIIAPWSSGKPVLCRGRVQKAFPTFWRNIGARQLLSGESYFINAQQRHDNQLINLSLHSCKASTEDRLICKTERAVSEIRLTQGAEIEITTSEITNWTYARHHKYHRGCTLLRSYAMRHCESAARTKFFSEFVRNAVRRDPKAFKHTLDVRLNDNDLFGGTQPLEARLVRCRSQASAAIVCEIDSAPPETGLNPGDRYEVDVRNVVSWRYRIGQQQFSSCDGARDLRIKKVN